MDVNHADPAHEKMSQYFDGLAPAQCEALQACMQGRSFFLTGSAGTGKSEVVRRMSQYLEDHKKVFWIAGTTGIAAVNIGGRTIHSLLRLNPDLEELSLELYTHYLQEQITLLSMAIRQKRHRNPLFDASKLKISYKWLDSLRKLEVLILDEVSMLSIETLEKIERTFQVVRHKSHLPMGGVRTILVGDFYQLPPVKKHRFLFESPIFYKIVSQMVSLTVCFRQSETAFVELLHRFRQGRLSDSDISILESRLHQNVSIHGIEPTTLYSRNMDVDRMNRDKLNSLEGLTLRYTMRKTMTSASRVMSRSFKTTHSSGQNSDPIHAWPKLWQSQMDAFVRDLRLEPVVELKVGAQVMLTYNLDVAGGLCNGSRGVITGFTEIPDEPDPESLFHQHDFGNSAVGRIGTGAELPMVYPKQRMPVVQFCNGRKIEMPYVRWTRTLQDPDLEASSQLVAWQVPLKLAWATTIHKSQGLTLDCVAIQMDRSVFEAGQAYVAVSRVKSLQGLSLLSWDSSVIKAHDKVLFFSQHSYDFLKEHFSSEASNDA